MQKMMKCPESGLVLPSKFIDEKVALKKVIDEWLEKTVMLHQHLDMPYFITFHAKFDPITGDFKVDAPVITYKIPSFTSNQMVYWVNNRKGICELLWMVPPKRKGEKLKVNFNTQGVAYLQAKGAMPSNKA